MLESAETVRGVRIPLVPEKRRHRALDERIVVRFPALARWLSAAWARLPRHSRLRRGMLMRTLRQFIAAWKGRDFDVVLTTHDPAVAWSPIKIFPDPNPVHHGYDGYRTACRLLLEAFEDLRLEHKEVLDLGDRILFTAELSGHGVGSGIAVNQQIFLVCRLRNGLVFRHEDFLDRAEALEAVGLSE